MEKEKKIVGVIYGKNRNVIDVLNFLKIRNENSDLRAFRNPNGVVVITTNEINPEVIQHYLGEIRLTGMEILLPGNTKLDKNAMIIF